ncbi:hypothetical protein K469DRAFT_693890 [Zopfia rhizophila CBS 207.26]|uniref:CARDB domain-containing protein n=1 Tax=Zopfia rhizophila CBS 207.26 TaxID=1314779 RepID=A0A6A6DPR9_9PEZI|nr:hypothetical protein K469DRAFT_693890 [Zopfia rhizophila CBS 207.26]
MARVTFGGRDATGFPLYFNPNIFFTFDPSDPTPAIPTRDVPIYIFASVTNTGKETTNGASVKFWICSPSTVPVTETPAPFAVSNVSLNPGETKEVLCVRPWIPEWTNNGHVCIVCEVSDLNDPAPAHPPTTWNVYDRHVAQHNVDIRFNEARKFGILSTMSAFSLPKRANIKVSIRQAPKDTFKLAMAKFGLKGRKNVSDSTHAGLLDRFEPGDTLPQEAPHAVEWKDFNAGLQRPFHAFLKLPDDHGENSTAIYFVEQHDDKGKLVGGVAIILLGGKQLDVPRFQPAAPAIPIAMSYRPYATDPGSGIMIPDGLFISILGQQYINIETRNKGSAILDGISLYIEGVADPAISAPIRITSPLGGRALGGASFKSIFSADFTYATPGATRVSFIVQQRLGTTTTSVRILKKIFVVGVGLNKATKTWQIKVPEGTLHYHAKKVIALKDFDKGGSTGQGCKCPDSGEDNKITPIPIFPLSGTLFWVPSTPYAGTHGPLPFEDPVNKAIAGAVAAVISLIALIAWLIKLFDDDDDDDEGGGDGSSGGGGGGSTTAGGGVSGTFDETTGEVSCCTGVQIITDNTFLGAISTLAVAAWFFTLHQDGKDLHEYGRDNTTPAVGELTVGELVEFDIVPTDQASPGVAWGGDVKWKYERALDSGMFPNPQHMDRSQANDCCIDGKISPDKHYIHMRKKPLVIGAQFVKLDGSLFTGSDLYVFAWLWSNRGQKISVELRDDGYDQLAGFDEDGTSLSAEEGREIRERVAPGEAIPNTGSYVAVANSVEQYSSPTTWYVFVLAQDVNTVAEGTEPREAAKTIGGFLLTTGYKLKWDGSPCEMDYDAVVEIF